MNTFTEVAGVPVIEAQLAKSALSRPDKPVVYKNTEELLLEDGSVVFGCLWCGKQTDPKIGRLRLHQRYNCPDRPPAPPKAEPTKPDKHYPPWTKNLKEDKAWGSKANGNGGGVKEERPVSVSDLVRSPSVHGEPPPSAAGDILAALRNAHPVEQDLTAARNTIKTQASDMSKIIKQRDAWKTKYEELETEMGKIRALLKERGLM